jgi:hypothetical protein
VGVVQVSRERDIKAVAELGRIAKTLYLLAYAPDDEASGLAENADPEAADLGRSVICVMPVAFHSKTGYTF